MMRKILGMRLLCVAVLCASALLLHGAETVLDFVTESEIYGKNGWQSFKGDQSLEEQLEAYYLYRDKHREDFVTVRSSSDVLPTLEEAELNAFKKAQFYLCLYVADRDSVFIEGTSEYGTPSSESFISVKDAYRTTGRILVTEMYSETDKSGTYLFKFKASYAGEEVYSSYSLNEFADEKFEWPVLERTCFTLPLAKRAITLFRAYRKVKGGYEVHMGLTSAVENAGIRIGSLYYALDRGHKTAEVVYHTSNKTLKNVSIPPFVTYKGVKYTVTSIVPTAFVECNLK